MSSRASIDGFEESKEATHQRADEPKFFEAERKNRLFS